MCYKTSCAVTCFTTLRTHGKKSGLPRNRKCWNSCEKKEHGLTRKDDMWFPVGDSNRIMWEKTNLKKREGISCNADHDFFANDDIFFPKCNVATLTVHFFGVCSCSHVSKALWKKYCVSDENRSCNHLFSANDFLPKWRQGGFPFHFLSQNCIRPIWPDVALKKNVLSSFDLFVVLFPPMIFPRRNGWSNLVLLISMVAAEKMMLSFLGFISSMRAQRQNNSWVTFFSLSTLSLSSTLTQIQNSYINSLRTNAAPAHLHPGVLPLPEDLADGLFVLGGHPHLNGVHEKEEGQRRTRQKPSLKRTKVRYCNTEGNLISPPLFKVSLVTCSSMREREKNARVSLNGKKERESGRKTETKGIRPRLQKKRS